MTVVPPFFLVAITFAFGFLIAAMPLGLFLKKMGVIYPESKIPRPFKTVFGIVLLAFLIHLIIGLPVAAVSSVLPGLGISSPPYLFWFFTVGFVVFLFRLDGERLSLKKAKIAAGLCGGCILWLVFVLQAFMYVVG